MKTREEKIEMVRAGQSPKFQTLLVEKTRFNDIRLFWSLRFGQGVSISIQAGSSYYSRPRCLLPLGDHSYTDWEVGFSRKLIEGLPLDKKMNWESPEDDWTVAGYVPSALVQELCDFLFIQFGPKVTNG